VKMLAPKQLFGQSIEKNAQHLFQIRSYWLIFAKMHQK